MTDFIKFTGINWKWVGVSVLFFLILQVILGILYPLIGILTLGLAFIFSFLIKPLIYFAGGFATGFLSPGITIYEPAIGALISSVIGFILEGSSKRGIGILALIISTVIAFICGLAGAALGEKKSQKK